MTGFGSASCSEGGLTVGVEVFGQQPDIESVWFDCPKNFCPSKVLLETDSRGTFSAGSLTVSVRVQESEGSQAGRIDEQAFHRYLSQPFRHARSRSLGNQD